MIIDFDKEFGFCPELVRLYASGFAKGANDEHFKLDGCSTTNNLIVLRRMLDRYQPRKTLEIGLCLGGSCLLFTAIHKKNGAAPRCQHTAIDPFQISMWKEAGLLAIRRAGLNGFLNFRESLSSLELPRLMGEKAMFDFVYIDGSHIFEDVFIDFYYVARLLCDGGIVAFDDSADPHVAKVLRFISSNLTSSFNEVDLGPFRLDGGRPLRFKVAKLLRKTQMRAFQKTGPAERCWDAAFTNF